MLHRYKYPQLTGSHLISFTFRKGSDDGYFFTVQCAELNYYFYVTIIGRFFDYFELFGIQPLKKKKITHNCEMLFS